MQGTNLQTEASHVKLFAWDIMKRSTVYRKFIVSVTWLFTFGQHYSGSLLQAT